MDLWVGDLHSVDESIREAYRSADLILSGLEYFSVDAPDPNYLRDAPWQIDLCDADPEYIGRYPVTEGCFAARFYSSDINAFIHFAAKSAAITFQDEGSGFPDNQSTQTKSPKA